MKKEQIEKQLNTYPISAWPWPRILIHIPIERTVPYAELTFSNFLYIASQGPQFVETNYGRIDLVRNLAVMELLKSEATHILFLDLDHVHPVNIIQSLARWVMLDPEKQIVSGFNFRRSPPHDPVLGILDENGNRMTLTEWGEGLIKVDEVGGASLLVAREVFEKMEPPWFFNDYSRVMQNNWPGEDIGFCRKCKELGIPIYVDTTTQSPHCMEQVVTEETYRTYLATHPEAIGKKHEKSL